MPAKSNITSTPGLLMSIRVFVLSCVSPSMTAAPHEIICVNENSLGLHFIFHTRTYQPLSSGCSTCTLCSAFLCVCAHHPHYVLLIRSATASVAGDCLPSETSKAAVLATEQPRSQRAPLRHCGCDDVVTLNAMCC